jgi:arginine exporter protein ArgO
MIPPSKNGIFALIMAAAALVWYFSIKLLAKLIENTFSNEIRIN